MKTFKRKVIHTNALSIRHLLLRSLLVSIVIFLCLFSLAIIWLTQKGASTLIVSNAQETVQVLAEQGRLALLTDSPENASNALEQVNAFPDVVGAGLISSNGEILIWQGSEIGEVHFKQQNWQNYQGLDRVNETDDYWHISAKVIIASSFNDDEQLDLFETSEEHLGFAVVSFSKNSLQNISRDLFVTISIASLFVMIGLPLVVILVTRRLLYPLQSLSDVMSNNHLKGEHQIAEVQGAKEVQLMALSFNALMKTLDKQDEKLRNHRDRLEAKVQLRTRELVTARDAALTSNRYKSEFLANVTHELRSPIQSIMGYVELAKEEAENEGLIDISTDLDKVTRNAERLYNLINSLLDLSKIEAGRMELKKQKVNLFSLIVSLEETTAPLAKPNKNTFTIVNSVQDIELTIDTEKTLQILINLVGNALKFTENGNVELNVSAKDTTLTFKVIDTGVGIPDDQLDSIFEQFQQVDGSEARKFGGTGLGLAISKQLCDMMQGQISVTSEVGKGSCFCLTLPLN
jgi:signal transduction histidine kinase